MEEDGAESSLWRGHQAGVLLPSEGLDGPGMCKLASDVATPLRVYDGDIWAVGPSDEGFGANE